MRKIKYEILESGKIFFHIIRLKLYHESDSCPQLAYGEAVAGSDHQSSAHGNDRQFFSLAYAFQYNVHLEQSV
jgi:hypothetical protein